MSIPGVHRHYLNFSLQQLTSALPLPSQPPFLLTGAFRDGLGRAEVGERKKSDRVIPLGHLPGLLGACDGDC